MIKCHQLFPWYAQLILKCQSVVFLFFNYYFPNHVRRCWCHQPRTRLILDLWLSLNRAGNPLITVDVTVFMRVFSLFFMCVCELYLCMPVWAECISVHAKKNTTANNIIQQDGNTSWAILKPPTSLSLTSIAMKTSPHKQRLRDTNISFIILRRTIMLPCRWKRGRLIKIMKSC